MSLYLDASALVSTLVEEASSAAVDRVLVEATTPLIVGAMAAIEVASAISRLVRMNFLSADVGQALLISFDQWRSTQAVSVNVEAADLRQAEAFVRRFELGLRAPDALHLAACRGGDHILVTLDRRLATVAATLGVEAMVPT